MSPYPFSRWVPQGQIPPSVRNTVTQKYDIPFMLSLKKKEIVIIWHQSIFVITVKCSILMSDANLQPPKVRSCYSVLRSWQFKQQGRHLCSRQRPPWTSPPQVLTSVHLLKKFAGSRFTISSPRFQNNWVKIHRRKKWDRSRFTKVKFLLRPTFTSLPKKLVSYLA